MEASNDVNPVPVPFAEAPVAVEQANMQEEQADEEEEDEDEVDEDSESVCIAPSAITPLPLKKLRRMSKLSWTQKLQIGREILGPLLYLCFNTST